jgi:aryl-alcohol dehydrogenase-like predicted oxidoreductase
MVQRAAGDGVWDVAMVAFHMMHQNARETVFPRTRANGVGTLIMFAVRNIFSKPQRLKSELRQLAAAGKVARWLGQAPNPLGFLLHADGDGAVTIPEAAYRFVRHEPGVDVVLFGTGEREHLRANIASILKPPLPETDRRILAKFFGHLSGVGLDPPTNMPGLSLH